MLIRFVGHAAVAIEAGDAVVLTDPWTRGRAFNDSWEPYPAPALGDDVLDGVTHLWISHEHPDHLSVPTLRSIPETRRAEITLLYQRHWSPEVATFLGGLGFRELVEVGHGDTVDMAPGVRARVQQVGHEDSALTIHDGRHTVMDLNDCKPAPATLRRMLRQVGPVDVLLDQFSIAGWPGNPGDTARLRAAAAGALAAHAGHVDIVRPRWVLPFASFVRFCHEENSFMNEAATPVPDAAGVAGPRTVVMWPGDEWSVDRPPTTTAEALDSYAEATEVLSSLPLVSHPPVPVSDVVAAAGERVEALAASFHRPLLRRAGMVAFELTDAATTVVVDAAAGEVRETAAPPDASVVRLSSQAAWYTFAHRWGLSTLLISGRFAVAGPEEPWTRLKQLGSAHAQGIRTRGAGRLVTDRRVIDIVRRRWPDLYRDVIRRAA